MVAKSQGHLPRPREVRSRAGWGRILITLLAAALVLSAALVWRSPETDAPLRLAVGVWPGSETFVYARETGMLPAQKVQIVEMAWSSAAKVAFTNRVVDAAVLSLDEVVRLRQSNHDVRVVLVLDFSKGADAVLARDPAAGMEGLRGKKIGVERQSAGGCLLVHALDTAGMNLGDLQIVPMNNAEMEASFREGEVDAVVAGEPWLTRLRGLGAGMVYDSTSASEEMCRVLAVRAEVLEKRPQEVLRLVKLHLDLAPLMRDAPDTPAMETICRRLAISRASYRVALSHLHQPDVRENLNLFEGAPAPLDRISQRLSTVLIKHGLIMEMPNAQPWLDASVLKEIHIQ
jgi:NitT/TauT family transport system substrate-binding protein